MNSFIKTDIATAYFSVGLMTSAHVGYICGASLGENNVNKNKFINKSYFAGLLWPIFMAAVAYDAWKDDIDE